MASRDIPEESFVTNEGHANTKLLAKTFGSNYEAQLHEYNFRFKPGEIEKGETLNKLEVFLRLGRILVTQALIDKYDPNPNKIFNPTLLVDSVLSDGFSDDQLRMLSAARSMRTTKLLDVTKNNPTLSSIDLNDITTTIMYGSPLSRRDETSNILTSTVHVLAQVANIPRDSSYYSWNRAETADVIYKGIQEQVDKYISGLESFKERRLVVLSSRLRPIQINPKEPEESNKTIEYYQLIAQSLGLLSIINLTGKPNIEYTKTLGTILPLELPRDAISPQLASQLSELESRRHPIPGRAIVEALKDAQDLPPSIQELIKKLSPKEFINVFEVRALLKKYFSRIDKDPELIMIKEYFDTLPSSEELIPVQEVIDAIDLPVEKLPKLLRDNKGQTHIKAILVYQAINDLPKDYRSEKTNAFIHQYFERPAQDFLNMEELIPIALKRLRVTDFRDYLTGDISISRQDFNDIAFKFDKPPELINLTDKVYPLYVHREEHVELLLNVFRSLARSCLESGNIEKLVAFQESLSQEVLELYQSSQKAPALDNKLSRICLEIPTLTRRIDLPPSLTDSENIMILAHDVCFSKQELKSNSLSPIQHLIET